MAGSVKQDLGFDAPYAQALGRRLKALRLRRDLSIDQLRDLLPSKLCTSTLRSYEAGERRTTVQRLAEICGVLRARPSEILAEVEQELASPSRFWIDEDLLIKTQDPQLRPLRTWARIRLVGVPTVRALSRKIEFNPAMLCFAAQLCGLESDQLVAHLQAMGKEDSDAAEVR